MAAPKNRKGGRKPRSVRQIIFDRMRTKAWFVYLKEATGSRTAYEIGKMLLKADDKLFERYERGSNTPTLTTLKLMEREVAGSLRVFEVGPQLPGESPGPGLWRCLAGPPHILLNYLLSFHEGWRDLHSDGCSFNELFAEIAGDFLVQQTDHSGAALFDFAVPDTVPDLYGRLEALLTPPIYASLLGQYSGTAAKSLDHSQIVDYATKLLSLSNAAADQLKASTPEILHGAWAEMLDALDDPVPPREGYGKNTNPLLQLLESWRMQQLRNANLGLSMLEVLTALLRYGEAMGENTAESSGVYVTFVDIVAPRILSPFGIAGDFYDFITMHEWIAPVSAAREESSGRMAWPSSRTAVDDKTVACRQAFIDELEAEMREMRKADNK